MATQVTTRYGASEPVTHTVQEDTATVTNEINVALSSNLRFVTLTDDSTGKDFSVVANDVIEIKGV